MDDSDQTDIAAPQREVQRLLDDEGRKGDGGN